MIMGKLIDNLKHLETDVNHLRDDVEHLAKFFFLVRRNRVPIPELANLFRKIFHRFESK